jgi:hypothetical protein
MVAMVLASKLSSSSSLSSTTRGPLSLPLMEGLMHRPGAADAIVDDGNAGTRIAKWLRSKRMIMMGRSGLELVMVTVVDSERSKIKRQKRSYSEQPVVDGVGPVIKLAPEQFQTKYSDIGGRIKNGALILLDTFHSLQTYFETQC